MRKYTMSSIFVGISSPLENESEKPQGSGQSPVNLSKVQIMPTGLLIFVFDAFFLSHAIAVDKNSVGIMDYSVADSIGDGRFGNFVVPVLSGKLRTENSGSAFVAVVDNIEDVSRFRLGYLEKKPFIEDQQIDLFVGFDGFLILPLRSCYGEFAEKFGQTYTLDRIKITVGGYAEGV